MKRVKLSLNYKGLDSSGKVVFATNVYDSTNGNPKLPNCAPYMPQLFVAKKELNDAIIATNPSAITIKTKEIILEKVLYVLKAQVELECGDSEDIAASSGFSLTTPHPKKSQVFIVTQGTLSGTVDIKCVFVKGACYVWEMIADPINTNTWVQINVSNTTNIQVTGLTAGNKYWFRAKAVVKDQHQPYSDPYMVHVI